MHQIYALFLMLLLFVFTGCEEKTNEHNTIPVENTTQVVGEPSHTTSQDDSFKVSTHRKSPSTTPKIPVSLSDTFTLTDTKNRHLTMNLSNKYMTIKENTKPIVLVTFFASWCPPCLYEIPYLNDLQKKYQTHLFLAGVLVHDAMDRPTVKSFVAKHTIKYYVSNSTQNNDFASLTAKTLHLPHNFPIPLSVMYVNGTYFTHYEGIVPIEMIEYDIEEAIKTLK
ncbi:MAG: TlpA family protein disulfide reductase [Epsilonproteobacteria bacterium]|nr:TlpA family protein disulfide reductase [Campylobacterota bacterium]